MKDIVLSEDGRHYLSLLQENITRMATNSANCKTWLITIVSALCAIQLSKPELQEYILLTLVPITLFWLLDCYYLGMERRFIKLEGQYLKKEILCYDFNIARYGSNFCYTFTAMCSFSTTPLYAILALIVCALKWLM